MTENKAMTAFAQAALQTSEMVNAKFESTRLGGTVNRGIRVVPPEGESTQGGKKARESINLVPTDGDTSRTLTAGFLDVGLRGAELRTWQALDVVHQQRFQRPLDIPKKEYDAFIAQLTTLLTAEGFAIKTVDATAQTAKVSAAPVEKPANPIPIIVGAVGGLVVVAGLLWWFVLRG